MIKKARPARAPNTKALPKADYPVAPAVSATVTLVAGKMRMTFTSPVIVQAVPTAITANALHATTATTVSPTVVDLGFAVAPVATQAWVIPAGVPQIKNSTGGTVAAAGGVF